MMIVCVCIYVYYTYIHIYIYIVYTGVYYMTTIKHHVFRVYIYICSDKALFQMGRNVVRETAGDGFSLGEMPQLSRITG
jgi:hypothetical protein